MLDKEDINLALEKLNSSIEEKRKPATCLVYWSRFVRLRDGYQCVVCKTKKALSAHHIVRKSFLPEAACQTGNGITLCRTCHKEVHAGFNGRADRNLPMDAQGGEKIDILTELFDVLAVNAVARKLIDDDYYFLSDQVLAKFKLLQSFDADLPVKGYRIEQAALIWYQSPSVMRKAIFEANGLNLPNDTLLERDSMFITFD